MRAVLITFTTKTRKFSSNYERNKFFRGLYGWKQIVRTSTKRYVYRREGLLDEMPHFKVDQSMFVIMKKHFEKIRNFLDEWNDKIKWDEFEVFLNEEQKKMLR